MSKTGWIVLLVVGTCAGFVVGFVLGREGRRQAEPERIVGRGEAETTVLPRDGIGGAGLDELRVALAEKEDRVAALEGELADLQAALATASTEDSEGEPEPEETGEQRELVEKWRKLRNSILQRKDEALRAQSVEELATSLASPNREETLLWLMLVSELRSAKCDKEKLKAPVLGALRHEDPEVRRQALNCVEVVCASEELPAVLLEPLRDSSADVRRRAASIVAQSGELIQNNGLVAALETLLKDDDEDVRGEAIGALWRRPEYASQMEDTVIELSHDPDRRRGVTDLIPRGQPVSARLAQRLMELCDETDIVPPAIPWRHLDLSDDAKPIAVAHSLRVVRDDIEFYRRLTALRFLRDAGDASVLSELEKIAGSDDAEGIEKQLAETIEHLRQQASQPR